MKIVRAIVGSLLFLTFALAVASAATRRPAADVVGAGDAPLAGQAVPAAAQPSPPVPTAPPLPTLVPTPPPCHRCRLPYHRRPLHA